MYTSPSEGLFGTLTRGSIRITSFICNDLCGLLIFIPKLPSEEYKYPKLPSTPILKTAKFLAGPGAFETSKIALPSAEPRHQDC